MIRDIEGIFKSITPDNIKDIPVIQDAMQIFIETLEDLSRESIDIRKIYENEVIKEELAKIYLDDLYNVLKAIEGNQKLIDTIDKINSYYNAEGITYDDPEYISWLRRDAIVNVSKYITDEHFLSFKSYKQKKGTKASIAYIYELLNIFTNIGLTDVDFRINEGDEPFHFEMEGTLPKEFYEFIIYPIAHPLGFTYNYSRFMSLALEDYFPELNIVYNVNLLRVVCLIKEGSNAGSFHYDSYIGDPDNATTLFDLTGLEVIEIKTFVEVDRRIKEVHFNNGTYLKQITSSLGQTTVYLYQESGDPATEDTLLFTYSDHCSIEVDYTYIVNSTVTDAYTHENTNATHDYFARLDYSNTAPTIGVATLENETGTTPYHIEPLITSAPTEGSLDYGFYIAGDSETGLHAMDTGYNRYFDEDGNYIIGGSDTEGRLEHFYAPSWSSDLKILEGKYTFNYPDYSGETLVYTNTVQQTPVVTRVNPLITYQKQNEGNQEYIAREHVYDDQAFNLTAGAYGEGVLLEPIYNGTSNYIDFNGVNRGTVYDYLDFIGDVDGTVIKNIGNYYISGFYDQSYDLTTNPNNSIAYLETIVNGDPVNLQYNTFDQISYEYSLQFGVDNVPTWDEDGDNSLNSHNLSELEYEQYGVYSPDYKIGLVDNNGDYLTIGENIDYISGEAFIDLSLYGLLGKQTPAVVDAHAGGFDSEFITHDISGYNIYSYHLYTNQPTSYTSLFGEAGVTLPTGKFIEQVMNKADNLATDPVELGQWLGFASSDGKAYGDMDGNGSIASADTLIFDKLVEGTADQVDVDRWYNIVLPSLLAQTWYDPDDGLVASSGYTLGGDIYSEEVLAEVYRGDWNNFDQVNADGVNSFEELFSNIIPTPFSETYPEVNNGTEGDLLSEYTFTITYDVFDIDEIHQTINAEGVEYSFAIGDGTYITGSPHPITETKSTKITIDTNESTLYEYNTFANAFDVADDPLNLIGGDLFISGIVHSEIVDAEVYRSVWAQSWDDIQYDYTTMSIDVQISDYVASNSNDTDVNDPVYINEDGNPIWAGESNLDTAKEYNFYPEIFEFSEHELGLDTFDIGGVLVGNTQFVEILINGTKHEIADTQSIKIIQPLDQTETHTELDSTAFWLDNIEDTPNNIIGGDAWISYKVITVQTVGESYVDFDSGFAQNSDDDFTFGVYRGGVLLTDNNIAAAA